MRSKAPRRIITKWFRRHSGWIDAIIVSGGRIIRRRRAIRPLFESCSRQIRKCWWHPTIHVRQSPDACKLSSRLPRTALISIGKWTVPQRPAADTARWAVLFKNPWTVKISFYRRSRPPIFRFEPLKWTIVCVATCYCCILEKNIVFFHTLILFIFLY